MTNRITINGQHYDSPEAMPPDVRRLYDEAMRTLASGAKVGNTQVFTGKSGDVGASVVVNRAITVNHRTYGSVDELPPDVRRVYDDALKAAGPQVVTAHPKTSLHMSVSFGGSKGLDGPGKDATPLPIESSSTESDLRRLPMSLAIIIAIVLVLWAFMGR